jgi:subfamily B ATP-binding cassette protein MsbA
MTDDDLNTPADISNRKKLWSLYEVATFRRRLTAGILILGVTTAALEGIGLGFILPIVQQARGDGDPSGLAAGFARFYEFFGVPFTLEFIVIGVTVVIAVRYTAAFGLQWLRAEVRAVYIRHLRQESFSCGLDANVAYFDQQGSDEVLNAIITQTRYAGESIRRAVRLLELSLISLAYLSIAMYIAPVLTVLTGVVMGGFMFGIRQLLEAGASVGGRVASANERVQEAVQAGMQGIREVKLFNMTEELYSDFQQAVDQFVDATIDQQRNIAAVRNVNQFATAATVFGLIYLGLRVFSLTLGSLAVFLFAMFRLGPKVSNLNDAFYGLETDLPHLVRTQRFIDKLERYSEPAEGDDDIPPVETTAFENVSFSYNDGDEQVLNGVSFAIERGEFIGFVGQSGAGKSTIVSLLARLYEPDEGRITANGTSISEFDITAWRRRVSVVRQDPFLFNDTLRANLTVGNRDATQAEVERVAEIAQVTEFLNELPERYDTLIGDDGVRLSGGQRQRVAIARALLKRADLLVLDEATSDLDTRLEMRVHRAIEEMERDYAMIAIAHRLSTVTDADRIYTMDDGQIVESGSHEELIEARGQYAGLYASQS